MGLRQTDNKMPKLGRFRRVSPMMQGGAQGRPMLMHNGVGAGVNGGYNAMGTQQQPMGGALSPSKTLMDVRGIQGPVQPTMASQWLSWVSQRNPQQYGR